MDRYSEEVYEVMSSDESDPENFPTMMSPESSVSHIKAINHASGKGPSLSEEVTSESFGSLWSKDVSLWLKKQPNIESSENSYICKICSESFSLPISLLSHMKCHDEIGIQQCQFYRSKFKKKRNLDCRFETQNETRDSSYDSTIRKRSYTIRKSFTNHMQSHRQLVRTTALNDKSASEQVSTNHRGLTYDNLNKCATCGKTYQYRKGLSRHLKINPEHREIYFCNVHNKSFSRNLLFQLQTEISKSDSKNKIFQCPFCQTKFKKENHLCCHLVAHRDKTCNLCIRCNMCASSFSLPSELLTHLKMHEKTEASEKTEIVSAVRPSENSEAKPTSNSEPVTNIIVRESNFNECDICKKTYVKRKSLLKHMRTHITGRKYLCNICGLSFFNLNPLNRHMQRHTGVKNFTCDKCGNSFYSMSLLNQHLKNHTTEESGQIPDKVFQKKHAVSFGCEICNTKFETKKGYSLHMKQHNATEVSGQIPEKVFQRKHAVSFGCKICNTKFETKKGYSLHMKKHNAIEESGQRPAKLFECEICNAKLLTKQVYSKHRKRHIEGKRHECGFCQRKFYASYRLIEHMRTHTGEKPYKCKICSKSFNYKKNMVAHVQRWHPSSNPFRCKLCSKTYDTIRKIDVHINSRACVKIDKSHKKSKNPDKSIKVGGNTNAENLFMCNVCNEDFESVEKIHDHFNSSHKPFK